jgi:hypothetical protein
VYIENVKCNDIAAKESKHITINTGRIESFYTETELEDVNLNGLVVTNVTVKKETNINNCVIGNIAVTLSPSRDCIIANSVIGGFSQQYQGNDSEINYKFIGCDFKSPLSYIGFTNSMIIGCSVADYINIGVCENCYVNATVTKENANFVIKSQNNKNIEGVVMGNGGFTSARWDVGGNVNENISVIYA